MNTSLIKGVELKKIINYLTSFAPTSLSEKWDKTGLLVEPMTPKIIQSIFLTNDLTEDVLIEATDLNVGLIISYHPPIFQPLSTITTSSWKERIIGTCIENKIAIYSPHTSWDSVPGGINDWLASAFACKSVTPIIANEEPKFSKAGTGRLCKLSTEIKIIDAVQNVKKLTSLQYLNLALARNSSLDSKISTVAVCCGSGNTVLEGVEADLFVTGEMAHHNLLNANHSGTSVILCNHSNSERGFLKEFARRLEAEFLASDVQIYVSQKDKDPIQII